MSNSARSALATRIADRRVRKVPCISEAMSEFRADRRDEAQIELMIKDLTFRWGHPYHGGGECLRSETKVVDLDHLHNRLIAAMDIFTAAGGTVPGNLWKTAHMCRLTVDGPWRPVAYGTRRVPVAQAEAMITIYARLAGWLTGATEIPQLLRALSKTQGYGVNAKSTRVDLWAIVRKFRSPGSFWRLACATMSRARAVLSAYEGQPTPRWTDIFSALLVDARVGKAAIIATAMRIRGRNHGWKQSFVSYREARDWLKEHRTAAFTMVDEVGGIVAHLATEPELNVDGVVVHQALIQGKVQRYTLRVVRKGTRSYHGKDPDAHSALSAAIAAWEKEDEAQVYACSPEGRLEAQLGLPRGKVIISNEEVVVKHRLRARWGCTRFPDRWTQDYLAMGSSRVEIIEQSEYRREEREFVYWGSDEKIKEGDALIVWGRYFIFPTSVETEVEQIYIRPGIDMSGVTDWLRGNVRGSYPNPYLTDGTVRRY